MDKAPVVISPISPEDLPTVVRLVRSSFMRTRGLEQCRILKATLDNQIVGVAGFEVLGRYGLLRSFTVVKAYRKRKIARALLQNLIDSSRKEGLSGLYLVTPFPNVFKFGQMGMKVQKRSELPPEVRAHWQISAIGFRLLSPLLRFMVLNLN